VVGAWLLVTILFFSSRSKPNYKYVNDLERTNAWLWLPTGHEAKTDCAGEDRQQFLRPTDNRILFRNVMVGLRREAGLQWWGKLDEEVTNGERD
jgi:hypothetical protein